MITKPIQMAHDNLFLENLSGSIKLKYILQASHTAGRYASRCNTKISQTETSQLPLYVYQRTQFSTNFQFGLRTHEQHGCTLYQYDWPAKWMASITNHQYFLGGYVFFVVTIACHIWWRTANVALAQSFLGYFYYALKPSSLLHLATSCVMQIFGNIRMIWQKYNQTLSMCI